MSPLVDRVYGKEKLPQSAICWEWGGGRRRMGAWGGFGRKQLLKHKKYLILFCNPWRSSPCTTWHIWVHRPTETDLCDFNNNDWVAARTQSHTSHKTRYRCSWELHYLCSASQPSHVIRTSTSLSLWSRSTAVSFSFRLDTSVISSSFWVSSADRFNSSWEGKMQTLLNWAKNIHKRFNSTRPYLLKQLLSSI